MEILEYDQVDSLQVLHLNLLSLRYPLTPERVALMRNLDRRPFPFFALYAIERGTVAGQVGVFRLPVMTTEGPEDIGGVWAVSAHPDFSRRRVATKLMNEAHARMRAAGLRFSSLETSRHLGAHSLYQRLNYFDASTPASTSAYSKNVMRETDLTVERVGTRFHVADGVFKQAAAGRLGFTRRPDGFMKTMVKTGELDEGQLWLISRRQEVLGYAIANCSEGVLTVRDLVLKDAEPDVAVAALLSALPAPYVHVLSHLPSHAASLQRAGYLVSRTSWGTFMLRPLTADNTVEDARRLMAIGTDRFMISPLDTT